MRISATQIGTFEKCRRYWFQERILKLAVPQGSYATDTGSALHTLAESWLNDDVPPLDWDKGLKREDAERVQELLWEAVGNGTLFRHPQAVVEEEFLIDIIPGVQLLGYIDLRIPGEAIIDHKSSSAKNPVRYWETEQTISENKQLLTYAVAKEPNGCKVRHNQFGIQGKRKPQHVEGYVTADRVAKHAQYLRDVAADMVQVAQTPPDDFMQVPGPADPDSCSRWYGNVCPFARRCSGRACGTENSEFLGAMRQARGTIQQPTDTQPTMSLFSKPPARHPKAAAPVTPEQPAATPAATASQSAPVAPTVQPAQVTNVGPLPPWAQQDCVVCQGTGFEGGGHPCPLDARVTKTKLGVHSGMYAQPAPGVFEAMPLHEKALRNASWPLRGAWGPNAPSDAPAAPDAVQSAPEAPDETVYVDAETGAPETPAQPEAQRTEQTVAEKPKRGRGRPPGAKNKPKVDPDSVDPIKGPTNVQTAAAHAADINEGPSTELDPEMDRLVDRQPDRDPHVDTVVYIGCVPGRTGYGSVRIQEVLAELGGPEYYSENAFQRRDRVRSDMDKVFEVIGGRDLVCVGAADPDAVSLLAAILGDPRVLYPVHGVGQ